MVSESVIQVVIDEYRKSRIQSEAEVSSKFIVPLFEALGYPSELRSEEYPVYGYGGREPLKAKDADFIFFTESDFSQYRSNTQRNKKWVQEHSLLIVEAKKPGKMPDDLGQAQFYTMWTKAVAYIETDGEVFKGYYMNPLSSDLEVIDVKVDELATNREVWKFSYENILAVKSNGNNISAQQLLPLKGTYTVVTEDADLDVPIQTIDYMRHCLGKNADGLTNIQIVSRFLNTTDSMLQNDMRYDIPPYMFDVPRHVYKAKLYIDDMIFPYIYGEVTEFYRNDDAKYIFESDYIEIFIAYNRNNLRAFEIGYHILDRHVSERIEHFGFVRKCLDADSIRIVVENNQGLQMSLPAGHPKKMWSCKEHINGMFDFWLDGLKKLKLIEEYYEFEFKLNYVSDQKALNNLYEAIDIVYDGIMMNENCVITMPGDVIDEDLEISEPVLLEENKELPLPDQIIQGVVFRPYRSALLPCKIAFSEKTKKDIIRIPACCEYRIIEEESAICLQ